jgi:4-carboxymuconolactone decarboxylase
MSSPLEPRLAPLPFADWDNETRSTLLSHLRRPELYLSGNPDAPPMPVVLELLAHHLPLSEAWLNFSDVLVGQDSTLSPLHRELLILRVAWRMGSSYEWTQHERMGREVGLTDPQIEAIRQDLVDDAWTPSERALLKAADDMFNGFAVSTETWQSLSESFDSAQILELLFVIGSYACLAFVLNSVELHPPLPPT